MVLALGIGVNVTAFNIIDVVLLSTAAGARSKFTCASPHSPQKDTSTEVAYPAAMFYQQHNQVLESVIVQRWLNMTFGHGKTENVHAGLVSANYFSEIGASAAYGRLTAPIDASPGAAPAAVLGYGYWQRHFGGDASVVGRTITLNQHVATVVGITGYAFSGSDPDEGQHTDLWLLVEQEPYFVPQTRVLSSFNQADSHIHMWGRLKSGVTMKMAEQALLPLAQELAHEHPDLINKNEHLKAAPGAYAANLGADDLPLFGLLSVLVLLILATACGNLGNLLLGRAITREREIATRLALGATRGRVVRQLLTESLLLAAIGSALGLLLSWLASRALVVGLGGPGNFDYAPDWRTVLFAFAVGTLACLLAGLPRRGNWHDRSIVRRAPVSSLCQFKWRPAVYCWLYLLCWSGQCRSR